MDIKQIKEMIAAGETVSARSAIITELNSDRFSRTMQAEFYLAEIKQNASDVFEKDDARVEFKDEGWNYTYWKKISVRLNNNFSEEKLTHYVKVMVALRAKGDPQFIPQNSSAPSTTPKSSVRDTDRKTPNSAKWAGYGAVAGGVAGFIAKHFFAGAIIGGVTGFVIWHTLKSQSDK